MDNKVSAFAATPDPTFGQAQPDPKPAKSAAPEAVPAGPDPVDLRLVIEEDQASGSYVYKTVNWRTGEVVQSLPRAEILRLKEEARYAAGSVVSTKA